MKKLKIFCYVLFLFLSLSLSAEAATQAPLVVRVFHMPACKACQKLIHDVIPRIARAYGDRLDWVYIDVSEEANYKRFLSLEKYVGRSLATPTVLIGKKAIVGVVESVDALDATIADALVAMPETIPWDEDGFGIDLLERFRGFGSLAIIGAGLVDGVNPCAFTVIVFFISFLTVAGYRRKEMALIGLVYIFAIFVTYLAIGLGCFKVLYGLKSFHLVSKILYLAMGSLSLYLGGLALKDYFIYAKTGRTEGLALQLPRAIKNKIHSIVGAYYRKGKHAQKQALGGLMMSALVVGFMVSLLESVCTGQMYLPTIVFVLKEKALSGKPLLYLIIYNVMFIVPLLVILLLSLKGVSSKDFEKYAHKHLGVIKLAMAAVFLALGIVLWLGV